MMERSRRVASSVSAGLLCLCFGCIVVISIFSAGHDFTKKKSTANNQSSAVKLRSYRRALSNNEEKYVATAEDVKALQHPYGDCEIPPHRFANHELGTLYQPAFPGSGSRMTYELVQALTGYTISNDHNYAVDPNVRRKVVSVKTHYPNRNGISLEDFDEDFHGAILVIRNPIKAIPSFYNFWYERLNHLENHSVRAPKEEWIAYRDANLEEQLRSWRWHMDYWIQKYQNDRSKLLILPYEMITHNNAGPVYALKLAQFLDSFDGISTPQSPEKVACLWHRSVKYMDEGEDTEERSIRKGSTSTPYTSSQFEAVQRVLREQKRKYENDPEIYKILDQYLRHIGHYWLYVN